MYLGDFRRTQTVRFQWNSFNSSGASVTRTTNGTISVYKDGGVTQTTTGVTDTEDFDGLTGVHDVAIATTDSFYVAGSDYTVVLSAATIDGQTVNAVLAHFSIENRFRGEASRATAQGGAAQAITLATTESATDDALIGWFVRAKTGTGAQQKRVITDYVGSTKVATVDRPWVTVPDSTTVYELEPDSLGATLAEITDEMWDEPMEEPLSVPAVTGAARAVLAWLLVLSRNKITQTSTTQTVRNDSDNADIASASVSDNGTTFTRGEFA